MLDSGVTLDSDVYLASHHGSEGSSSEAFMRAVSPTAVVVECWRGELLPIRRAQYWTG